MMAGTALLVLVTLALGQPPHPPAPPHRPPFRNTFPWARVPTMCQTHMSGRFVRSGNMSGDGRLDDKVIRFLTRHYDVVVANDLQPGQPTACLEPKVRDFAARVKRINPHTKVLFYMASQMHHGKLLPPGHKAEENYACGLDKFKPEWIATLDDGSPAEIKGGHYIHNLSNPDMREWWIDVATNTSLGDNVAGIFADNSLDAAPAWASAERGKGMVAGQQALLDAMVGKGKYVIFNGLRYSVANDGAVRDDFAALDVLLPHASAGYFEGWLAGVYRNTTTGKLDEEKATHALLRMINVSKSRPEKGITFKAGPGPCVGYIAGADLGCTWPFQNKSTKPVPNEWNGTPRTPDQLRAAAAKLITFPLATFLCAAGPKWHLDYTWGYTINDFVSGEAGTHALPGQPNLQSLAPDNWYPDLMRAPGKPLGECTYSNKTHTFSREWSGVSVKLNMRDETAQVAWK